MSVMNRTKLNFALGISAAFFLGAAIGFYSAAALMAQQVLEALK